MNREDSRKLLFERMNYVSGMPLIKEGDMSPEEVKQHIEPEDKEKYAEAASYQVKLDKIVKNAGELHEIMKEFENLPAWVQDKITIAEHNMEAIRDWVESKAHDNKYGSEENSDSTEIDTDEVPDVDNGEDVEDIAISDDDFDKLSEGEINESDNVPTQPSKWNYYKNKAKEKFDVYPSAYANGWAAKEYKKAGGGWKKKKKDD